MLIFMHLVDISNNFRMILNFIEIIYMMIIFNPTVNFIIRMFDEKLSKISYIIKFDNLVSFDLDPYTIKILVNSYIQIQLCSSQLARTS